MAGVERITLRIGALGEQAFYAAHRVEALGAPVRLSLKTGSPGVLKLANAVGTAVEGCLTVRLHGHSQEAKWKGVFVLQSLRPRRRGWVLKILQTVDEVEHLASKWRAWHLDGGNYRHWLTKGGGAPDTVRPDDGVGAKISALAMGQTAVIFQAGQSDVGLGAWLAWAATNAAREAKEDVRFWLTGGIGKCWHLVKDEATTTAIKISDPAEIRAVCYAPVLSHRPYVKLATRVICIEHFLSPVSSQSVTQRLGALDLPKRVDFRGQQCWLIARHDFWATGPVPWRVRLEASARPPDPAWPSPSIAGQRILGVIVAPWQSGVSVECTLTNDNVRFPLRLTTSDAGAANIAGWQWVPSQGNRIVIDTDWRLTGLPALRYAERIHAADEAHIAELPPHKSLRVKVGHFVAEFLARGMRLG